MKIIIKLQNGKRKQIDCFEVKDCPGLVAHKSHYPEECWAVTHHSTGLNITSNVVSLKRAKTLIKKIHPLVDWENGGTEVVVNAPYEVKNNVLAIISTFITPTKIANKRK